LLTCDAAFLFSLVHAVRWCAMLLHRELHSRRPGGVSHTEGPQGCKDGAGGHVPTARGQNSMGRLEAVPQE
jgi:hypothetical protein